MYKLTDTETIIRLADKAHIPNDPANTDYAEYLEWLKEVEPVKVLEPDKEDKWKKVEEHASVHIIRDIDEEAMKLDFFNTLNGKPTQLIKSK